MSILSVNCYSIMIVFDIVHSDDYRAASKTTCRDFRREQRFALTIAAVWLPHCFKYNLPRCSPRAEVCADNSHSMIRATSKTTCRDVRREQRFSLIIASVWLPRCFKDNLPRCSRFTLTIAAVRKLCTFISTNSNYNEHHCKQTVAVISLATAQ